uniref:Large ribosomal subunit protein eL20 domain-containing protein n=1 Tax=Zea mays TaxID=4577 RepID=A0A804NQG3_MAIZE
MHRGSSLGTEEAARHVWDRDLRGGGMTRSCSVNPSSPPPTAAGSSPVATSPVATSPECSISTRQRVARCQSPLMSTPRSTAWSLRYQRGLLQIQALVLSEEAQVSRRFKSNGQILAIDECRTGYHDLHKEYRNTTLNGAMEQMYNETASCHRVVTLHTDHQDGNNQL